MSYPLISEHKLFPSQTIKGSERNRSTGAGGANKSRNYHIYRIPRSTYDRWASIICANIHSGVSPDPVYIDSV